MLCAGAAYILELYCTLEQYLRKAVQKLTKYIDPSHWLLLQPHLGYSGTLLSLDNIFSITGAT